MVDECSYARAETRGVRRNAQLAPQSSNMYSSERAKLDKEQGPAVCTLRITSGGTNQWPYVHSVIVLTDKPQKPLPAAVWPAKKPIIAALVAASESFALEAQ